jgi:hypothetical protein
MLTIWSPMLHILLAHGWPTKAKWVWQLTFGLKSKLWHENNLKCPFCAHLICSGDGLHGLVFH